VNEKGKVLIMKNLRNLTLEVSLKPFWDTDPAAMEAVARRIFTQWGTLIRHADQVSIMLWTADGSEILDYSGNLDEPFDWARYMGCCNNHRGPLLESTPDGPSSLNSGYFLYRHNPPVYTYRILRDLVAILRRVGMEMTGKPVRIGETFDPGPEFAVSSLNMNGIRKLTHHTRRMVKTGFYAVTVCCMQIRESMPDSLMALRKELLSGPFLAVRANIS
jgi:hypothetical protein